MAADAKSTAEATTAASANANSLARNRIPLWYRLRRHFMRLPPLLIWLAAIVGAGILYLREEQGLTVTGFAGEIRYSVAPGIAGRLDHLEVDIGQDVRRGELIARLDDSTLLFELEEARVELERLKLELGRQKALWDLSAAGQRTDLQTNLRRFARDAEEAHIEYLDALANLAEDRIRLQGLELIANRSRVLRDSDVGSLAGLEQDLYAFRALEESVAKQEPFVETMRDRYEKADRRFEKFASENMEEIPSIDILLKPLEYAVKVQEVRIEQVHLSIAQLVLEAPARGKVAAIFRRSGEFVEMGQPVIEIVDPKPAEIVAYIPETRIHDVEAGASVLICALADRERSFESRVSFLASSIEQLPVRLAPSALAPSWGLAAHIACPENADLKPGEAIEIRFRAARF